MKVLDNGVTVVDIPIYIKSDSSNAITMSISNNRPLRNSDNEDIDTDFFYVVGGTETSIATGGSSFTLLANGAGTRDGNALIGYIRIKTVNLASNQTVGNYNLIKNMSVTLVGGATSSSATLASNGMVEYVTIVSFTNTISAYTDAEEFISAEVDFGIYGGSIYTEIRSLYMKSNSKLDCTLSFTPNNLKHIDDSNYEIPMKYYYTKTGGSIEQINNTPFTIFTGKKGGAKVGEMKFETEAVSSALLAGEYKATMGVTISAR
jgi:hypothetical protein